MNPLIQLKGKLNSNNSIFFSSRFVARLLSRFRRKRERFANRVATPASSTRFSVMMLSLATPPAPETQDLVTGRSFRIPPATSTPVLAVER